MSLGSTTVFTNPDTAVSTETKSGIAAIPVKYYEISAQELVTYFQNTILGGDIDVCATFDKWTGMTPGLFYTTMRVVYPVHQVIANGKTADNYVDRILVENSAAVEFKSTFIDAVKPFSYSCDFSDLADENRKKLVYTLGINDATLRNIQAFANPTIATKDDGRKFVIQMLRTEKILEDMITPPDGTLDGKFEIISVRGNTPETLVWRICVYKDQFAKSALDIDALFGGRYGNR